MTEYFRFREGVLVPEERNGRIKLKKIHVILLVLVASGTVLTVSLKQIGNLLLMPSKVEATVEQVEINKTDIVDLKYGVQRIETSIGHVDDSVKRLEKRIHENGQVNNQMLKLLQKDNV